MRSGRWHHKQHLTPQDIAFLVQATFSEATWQTLLFFFSSSPSETTGSVIIFGGIDESCFTGPINWISVSYQSYWQISVDR